MLRCVRDCVWHQSPVLLSFLDRACCDCALPEHPRCRPNPLLLHRTAPLVTSASHLLVQDHHLHGLFFCNFMLVFITFDTVALGRPSRSSELASSRAMPAQAMKRSQQTTTMMFRRASRTCVWLTYSQQGPCRL